MATSAEQHLAEADRHIAAAAARVDHQRHQRLLVAGLEMDGHDTSLIHALLATMKETQRLVLAHRAMLLDEIAALRSKPPPP